MHHNGEYILTLVLLRAEAKSCLPMNLEETNNYEL